MVVQEIANYINQRGYFATIVTPKQNKGNAVIHGLPYVVACMDGVFVAIFFKKATNLNIRQAGGKSVVVKDFNAFIAQVGRYL